MYLTLYDLESLKNNCDNVSKLVQEIKKAYNPSNLDRQLFVSRNDYNESLKVKNQIPQDFYYFRHFDIFVQIVFNKNKKTYQIYCDGYYSKILDKYEKMPNSDKSFIISHIFEECLLVYKELINEILDNKVLKNELF